VNGVGVLGNFNPPARQLFAKAYRPRTSGPRGHRQLSDSLAKLLRGEDQRFPEALAAGAIERSEDLTAARVENRQGLTVACL